MSDPTTGVYDAIDREQAAESATTRRKFVAGAAATFGGLGLLGVPQAALAAGSSASDNTVENILAVAATAEVLATIVNTVGPEKVSLDPVTRKNVRAAAREELIHYNTLVGLGGKPLTTNIWVPDAVFASRTGLLSTLVVGDQIFVNAYLIATTVFGAAGNGKFARYAAEFMGAEAVHRALARQSLGLLGNDRVFMKYRQVEEASGPGRGMPGFDNILVAVKQLEMAGIGFGKQGATPGAFYDFGAVKLRTPNPDDVNTRSPN